MSSIVAFDSRLSERVGRGGKIGLGGAVMLPPETEIRDVEIHLWHIERVDSPDPLLYLEPPENSKIPLDLASS
jgi:hypothetical protein